MFYQKGYNGTTVDDIIERSGTSKGSFYYFNMKEELLNTLADMPDDFYEELEEKISVEILASLYSARLLAQGQRQLLDRNRKYSAMCEQALISGWCLNKGEYSLARYSKECMPIMIERFKA